MAENTTEEAKKPSTSKVMPVLIFLLIIAAFVIGVLFNQVRKQDKGEVADTTGEVAAEKAENPGAPPALPPADVDVTGAPSLGKKGAKVAIVEFTDYQCPFCSQIVQNTFPQIKKEYIDTGKVMYFVMDFPLFQIHPQALKAAEASHCANDQGKYWEYHDELFNNQDALDVDSLKSYAVALGLDASKFNECLDSDKYADKVKDTQKTAQGYGVRGTPASFIGILDGNTVKDATQVSGAVPFENFQTVIEEALGKS